MNLLTLRRLMKTKIIIGIVILMGIALGIVFLYVNYEDGKLAKEIENLPVPTEQVSALKSYSLNEIVAHNNRSDCWIAIDNKVYNVTSFISLHPGGDQILQGCGKDSTVLFNSVSNHAEESVQAIKKKFYIGELTK